MKNRSTNGSSDDALKMCLCLQTSEASPLTGDVKVLGKSTCTPHPHPTPQPTPTPGRKHRLELFTPLFELMEPPITLWAQVLHKLSHNEKELHIYFIYTRRLWAAKVAAVACPHCGSANM